jgi:hypothetical protein
MMNENNPTRAATVMLNGARVLLKFIKDDKEEFKRIQQKRVEMISLALNVMIQIGKKENDGRKISWLNKCLHRIIEQDTASVFIHHEQIGYKKINKKTNA